MSSKVLIDKINQTLDGLVDAHGVVALDVALALIKDRLRAVEDEIFQYQKPFDIDDFEVRR